MLQPVRSSFIALLLCLFLYPAFAQKRVRGRIINNSDKQPIAGAIVQVKDTKTAGHPLLMESNMPGMQYALSAGGLAIGRALFL